MEKYELYKDYFIDEPTPNYKWLMENANIIKTFDNPKAIYFVLFDEMNRTIYLNGGQTNGDKYSIGILRFILSVVQYRYAGYTIISHTVKPELYDRFRDRLDFVILSDGVMVFKSKARS